MQELSPKQKRVLEVLAKVDDGGILALTDIILELQAEIARIENVKPDKGDKGDRGENGENGRDGLDGKDGQDGKAGREGKDGRDGRDGVDGRDGADGKDGENGKDGSPDSPQQVRDKLESLKGDDRLDVSAIKGLGKRETKLTNDLINRSIGIVDQRTSFLINKVSNLENRSSGGLASVAHDATLTGDGTSGNPLSVVITAGYTKETPTGTVDGSNATFTVTATPVYIVSDGITLFDGAGYTIATLTLTLDNPPSQFIRSFY